MAQQMTIKSILRDGAPGTAITAQGWVRTRRDSKGCSFVELGDGTCMKNLQVVIDANLPGYDALLARLNTGASLEVVGSLVESPGKGQRVELKADKVDVLGDCDAEAYPLQKKRHSNEFLRTIAHLRPRTNTFGAVFRVHRPPFG